MPVPEPSAWALKLAGIALIIWRRRRRLIRMGGIGLLPAHQVLL